MIKAHYLISSTLGIGYLGKGGGTVAAVVTCLVWYAVQANGNEVVLFQFLVTLFVTLLGIWSANQVEPFWGKDDKKVVIDEVAGMCISLIAVPLTWPYLLAALVLFRFFDIAKPLFIRKAEQVKGGWGVMLDDVLAGIYANLVVQAVLYFNLF
ncbi:phosphatidylglycerophosphatase [Rufibacter sp. DG15C]|uniref:phosphatidylglycerophosphatase A family protein n=1 Tax=Rufibacter sp. DG15C TaxID=1379909 RepID=UPI00078E2212|nr:phosphatidylglycerophosphatase A [Rufibacter sp. DG15C]AMM51700.1 phosphatidylglycerophosphatase [Rufibacter sp. DG15C]